MATLAQAAAHFRDEEECMSIWMRARWPDGVRCPRCETPTQRLDDDGWLRIRCKGCRKDFNAVTGTPLQGTHLSMSLWLTVIWATAKDQPLSGNRIAYQFMVHHSPVCRACRIVREIRSTFPRATWRWDGEPFELLLRKMTQTKHKAGT